MAKDILDDFKIFESNVRLKIISSLSISDLTYSQLKKICRCQRGNMYTHTQKLLQEGYISEKKEFVNKKPQTTYHLTDFGKKQFIDYVEAVQNLAIHLKK